MTYLLVASNDADGKHEAIRITEYIYTNAVIFVVDPCTKVIVCERIYLEHFLRNGIDISEEINFEDKNSWE